MSVGNFAGQAEQLHHFADRSRHVEYGDTPFLGPDETEKVFDRLGQALRLRDDDLHQAALRRSDRELVGKNLDGAGDGGEGIADLMRDAGGELSDSGKLLVESRLALEFLHFRQVLEEQKQALLAVCVPEGAQRIAENVARVFPV